MKAAQYCTEGEGCVSHDEESWADAGIPKEGRNLWLFSWRRETVLHLGIGILLVFAASNMESHNKGEKTDFSIPKTQDVVGWWPKEPV